LQAMTIIFLVPIQNPYFSQTEFYLHNLELPAYCPSTNNTACCSGPTCSFQMPQFSRLNMTFEVKWCELTFRL
jgi:hypothetical protein